MRVGVTGGGFDLGVARARPADGDIVTDGVVEENGFLRDERDLFPQLPMVTCRRSTDPMRTAPRCGS